ncbi:hypothetical protein BDR04DRAFT_1110915 [Suillus decipiens]|nr:hypothetical protein BDR04DRAFT_1110915 [Suillus decipiens]
MAVSLVGRNGHTQAWLMCPGQPSHFQLCVPRSVTDSMTCNIQWAHPHTLLPIMFLRHQCPIPPRLFILALHILYFLMDTCITHSLLSIIYIMHPTIHNIIRFPIILFTIIICLRKPFTCTSLFTFVTLLIL